MMFFGVLVTYNVCRPLHRPPPPNVNQRYHISLKSIYSNSVWILYNLIVQMHFSIQE